MCRAARRRAGEAEARRPRRQNGRGPRRGGHGAGQDRSAAQRGEETRAAHRAVNEAAALAAAVAALRAGGVIAYPTEAVYGLGCDPADARAFAALFALKQRPPTQGVLLIAADFAQVEKYIDRAATPPAAVARARATWPGPHTWVFPRAPDTPSWIAGAHAGIALRVTAHPLAAALCRAFGGALVSTSANRHGAPPARSAAEVRAAFGDGLAYILDGAVGGLDRPTPIRDAISGEVFRT